MNARYLSICRPGDGRTISEWEHTALTKDYLVTLEDSRPGKVCSDFLVINFELNCGSEDPGRLGGVFFVSRLPGENDGGVGDADGLEVPHRSGEADCALLVAEDDLADVWQALLEVCPRALLVDRLTEGLALGRHPPASTARQVVSPPGTAPHHLAELGGTQHRQRLDPADAHVVVAQSQTWI